MSKTPPATKPVPTFNDGDVVLAKVKGFSPWPSVIMDAENVPPSIKKEKPKGAGYYCVMFMPTGDFGWTTGKDISLLTEDKITKWLENGKKGQLYKGYELAKSPESWLVERKKQLIAQAEAEANAEEDELQAEDAEKSSKKRKGAAEPKASRKKKADKEEDSSSKKKRATKKRKADEESEDEKPSKKKAKKEEEEDETFAALANDPEAIKIKDWRHQLQRAFLRDNAKPEASSLPEYDETFNIIENYQGLTIQYLQYSKIGKVMKKISQLEPSHIPDDDGQFRFRERAAKLVTQWHQILNSNAKPTEEATVNGAADKSEDAPADPEPTAPAAEKEGGDTVMATDA